MTFGDALDEIASRVFGGAEGQARLQPLLSQWEDEVGRIHDDDEQHEVLQAVRTDWALCDANPGDTWLRRVMRGAVPGVPPHDAWHPLLGGHVGLFEVWPGQQAWLRDVRSGLSVRLSDPVRVVPLPEGGPGALWEVRIVIVDGAARMCRPPLSYPLGVLDQLHDENRARFDHGGEPVSLLRLRRYWLQWARAPRAEAAAVFRLGR
jgi:hypothetical protein